MRVDYEKIYMLLSWVCANNQINDKDISYIQRFDFSCDEWNNIYEIASKHAITPLFLSAVNTIPDSVLELKKMWKESAYSNIYSYSRLTTQQNKILSFFETQSIPIVVVKGTSAAKYYPMPQLRTMGDIDLLVRPNDYECAVNCLLENSCIEITSPTEMEIGRHRTFKYNSVSIELHHFFASHQDVEKATALDDMLFNSIPVNGHIHILPEEENGLTLLAHIGQHLEGGIGLRQIIDWMMFVRSYLNDENWYASFQNKAIKVGLDILSRTVTKMCQRYLGLTTKNITWCQDVEDEVCDNLMQYVMDCGNFGNDRELLQSSSISELPSVSHPIQLLKFMQIHGEHNWKALRKFQFLKPFSWLYQSCRYIKLAAQNKVGAKKLKGIYDEGNKRNKMFIALGIK